MTPWINLKKKYSFKDYVPSLWNLIRFLSWKNDWLTKCVLTILLCSEILWFSHLLHQPSGAVPSINGEKFFLKQRIKVRIKVRVCWSVGPSVSPFIHLSISLLPIIQIKGWWVDEYKEKQIYSDNAEIAFYVLRLFLVLLYKWYFSFKKWKKNLSCVFSFF